MTKSFLAKYFPPSKTMQYRSQITSFMQEDGETLSEAWAPLKNLKRECPHHGLEKWLVLSSFYDELWICDQWALDLSVRESFLDLNVIQAAKAITNRYESQSYQTMGRNTEVSTSSIRDTNHHTAIHARLDELSKLINDLLLKKNTPTQMAMCRTCGDTHHIGDLPFSRRSGSRASQLCESHFYSWIFKC